METNEGHWLSLTDLAAEMKVDKSTISRRVTDLEASGLITSRKGPHGAKMVNVAEYMKASGDTIDAVRSMNAASGKSTGAAKILAHEQARRTAFQADISELELGERLRRLLPVADMAAAVMACAETILHTIEQLPTRSDEIVSAVTRDGVTGARVCLKAFVFDIRKAVERGMIELEAGGIPVKPKEALP